MPTISEIKKLYPVGTVFFPAHLAHDDGNYVTIKDYHTYHEKSNGRIELGNMKPGESLYQPIICDVLSNGAVKMAKIISAASSLKSPLPSTWYLEVQPGNLDLINAYRKYKGRDDAISYPEYEYIYEDSSGTKSKPDFRTKISNANFSRHCEQLGISITSTSKSLPSNWYVEVEPGILDLVNAYRDLKENTPIDYPYYKYMDNNSTGNRVAPKSSGTEISVTQFVKLCEDLGIKKTSYSLMPSEWACYIKDINNQEKLDLFNAYRVSRDRGLDELSLENINRETETHFHEDGCRSSTLNGRSIIPFSKFEEHCKSLGIMKTHSITGSLPSIWAVKINSDNIDLINAYREYKGLSNPVNTSYDYILYDGCKYTGKSGYTYISEEQFKQVCADIGITVPKKVTHEGPIDVNNLPKYLGKLEHLRSHPQILTRLIELSGDKTLKVLMKNRGTSETGGISWSGTSEGYSFWCNILGSSLRDFNPEEFYAKYPTSETSSLGKISFLKSHPKILDRLREICKTRFDGLKSSPTGIFTWTNQKEGHDFWSDIMNNRNVDIFYTVYPEGSTTKVDEISNLGDIEFLRGYPDILEKIKSLSRDKSLRAFVNDKHALDYEGGFTWADTEEYKKDSTFWSEILTNNNPEYYYTLYPKDGSTKIPMVYTKGAKVKIITKTTGQPITNPSVQKALEKSPYGIVDRFDSSDNTYSVYIDGINKEARADFNPEDLEPYTDGMSEAVGYDSPIKSSRKTKLPQVEMIAVKTRRII